MQVFEPVASLRPFIKSFILVRSNKPITSRLIPGTSVVVAFRLNGGVRLAAPDRLTYLPALSISGLRSSYRVAEYEADSSNLIIEFKEGGAAAFLDLPLHELYESSVGLDELFESSAMAELLEQMHSRKLMREKVLLIQDFLISKLRQTKSDFLILSAVESIKLAHGAISVKQLAESLHTSLDPFEKRFRKVIGATPKQFADIIRMKWLIDRRNNQHLLVDTGLEAGFFDQSHFIRTFKKFTGQTPKHFFRSAAYQPD